MNLANLLQLKFPEELKNKQIILQDDGNGAYIKEWNVEGVAFPSNTVLCEWDDNAHQLYISAQNKLANEQIYEKLDAVDLKSIRALRTADTERLAALEKEASNLRAKLLPV